MLSCMILGGNSSENEEAIKYFKKIARKILSIVTIGNNTVYLLRHVTIKLFLYYSFNACS